MAIPKTVEQALDPNFRIDECADNKELQGWLTWTHPAITLAYTNVASAKYDYVEAEDNYNLLYKKATVGLEGGITEKKILAEIDDAVIEAKKKMNKAKYHLMCQEAILEGMKEKAGCIRKIATLRANMVQFDEGSISERRDNGLPSHEEQPYGNQLPPSPPMQTFQNNQGGYNKPAGSFMQ